MEFKAIFLYINVADIFCSQPHNRRVCEWSWESYCFDSLHGYETFCNSVVFFAFTWCPLYLHADSTQSLTTKKKEALLPHRIFVHSWVLASAKMMCQFMQMQCPSRLRPHHYCINLNKAALLLVLQIKDGDVALLKSNQQLLQCFSQGALYPPTQDKCADFQMQVLYL